MEWKINKTTFESDEINSGLVVSPWSGHRQFAYDLVEFLKPERIVELGTHYGCSFFAFLQACKDFDLNTEVVAIDSWQGDEEAGFYGEDVFATVNKTLDEKFSKQNYRTIRKFFCDAVDDIEDESVDILHIDGLHTYEAVSQDFNQYLPKLKKSGVILFHDVASKLGYGTNTFWKEIQEKYPYTFTFEHSWGLGILFPYSEEEYNKFLSINFRDKLLIYEYYTENNLHMIQLKDHAKMVDERDKTIASMTAMIDARDEEIKSNEAMIDERDKAIASMTAMIDERDKTIASMTAMIDERDKAIASMTAMIDERDKTIASMTKMIDEKDALMKEMRKSKN